MALEGARILAFVAATVTLSALFCYKDQGVRVLRRMARGELEAPSGLGSLYAKHFTTTAASVIYGIMSSALAISSFWLVAFILAPADFSMISGYSWDILLILIILGIGCGAEPSYQRMVEKEHMLMEEEAE